MNEPCDIDLLGGLQLRQGDRTIARFRTQKTAALLGYLACHMGRAHPRDALTELLWPDAGLDEGRRSLRTALSSLRHQLEPPGTPFNSVLITDRSHVRLNAQVVRADVDRFTSALQSAARLTEGSARASALEEALALYRGPLLPGHYDDWVLRERERLEQLYIEGLGTLQALQETLGEIGAAIGCAQRRVQADPYLEEAHGDLIRLLVVAGRVEAAATRYEEMERLYRSELGGEPPPAIRALAEDLPLPHRTRSAPEQPASALKTTPHETAIPLATSKGSLTASMASRPVAPLRQETHLPLYLTLYCGREDEIERLVGMLGRAVSGRETGDGGRETTPHLPLRLLTLTGPGGAGKTRLAVEVVRRLTGAYDNRIWFVPLADTDDAGRIPDVILDALAVPRAANREPLTLVTQALGSAPALLILDNFEHLVDEGASIIWTLLEQIPTVTCLLTSRQRLDLAGERDFPLGPLPVPSAPGSPERLVEFPSVRLFVDRAQAARPDFQITRENSAAIAAVCERLEGIPLAIELAAAWAAVLTPAQILERLSARFDLLASRRRGTPTRQRSLRDTIDWSYRLLTPDLRRFFAELSVFRGGWTLDAAEAICVEGAALDDLQALRDRSLIVAEETGGGIRFRMLETLREYAGQRLRESGEDRAVRERHAAHYLALVENAGTTIRGPEQAATLATLDSEHDNLRETLRYCVDPDCALAADARLRLGVAMARFWEVRSHFAEGIRWLEQLLAVPAEGVPSWRSKSLAAEGSLAWQLARFDLARRCLEEALTLSRQAGDEEGIAEALQGLGIVAEELGDFETARALLEESLTLKRQAGDRRGTAVSLNTLANVLTAHGEYEAARALFRESLELMRTLQDTRGISSALNNLAIVAYVQGDYEEARLLLEETLTVRRSLGDQRGVAICLHNLGGLAWRKGDPATALALYEQALSIRRELGHRHGIASTVTQLAILAINRGDRITARACLAESLAIFAELADRLGIVDGLEKCAAYALLVQEPERATRLLGAADRLRAAMGAPRPPIEEAPHTERVNALRALLGETAFMTVWQEGERMSSEQAIADALA